jgi:prepilin-type N-terminal cleavage/methylation domain-containing protein
MSDATGGRCDGLVPRTAVRCTMGRAGFTIVEMAIVIVLASVLMSLVVWRTGLALERARARQAVAAITGDIQYAQMLAARQREPVVIIVNPSLKLILIRSRGGTIFRQRFVGPSTEYGLDTLTASPTTTVEVFPNGVATSNMNVRAATTGYSREVRLSRAGQIRVVTP